MQIWTAEQVASFRDVTQAHRLHAAFYLALMTGMRRGEVMDLKGADVDFERSRLTVRHNLVEMQGNGIPGKTHAG
ncbi:tyrosine-type recombinase/integrase [Deinococcus sp. SM5_A1]|uniref:tyrosine-type recombinase/integrase n=1 Tax=Deinococcus sp. SM5_A1 TaxID=3379094 RepID=UPI00385990F6